MKSQDVRSAVGKCWPFCRTRMRGSVMMDGCDSFEQPEESGDYEALTVEERGGCRLWFCRIMTGSL